MGMVVRTNTMAINANRQLGMNNSQVAKSLEKLSSGFKINRAADDASGLAISEKMKAQIKGLEQASANSQDGISLIQTAEGATTEIHDMLNRMVELATKSANGTIQDEVDREAIQREVDDLNAEITRIAKSTNFNGINLLDGSLSSTGGTTAVSSVKSSLATTKAPATAGTYTTTALQISTSAGGDEFSLTVSLDNGKSHTIKLKQDANGALTGENGKVYGTGGSVGGMAKAYAAAINDSDLGKSFNVTAASNGALTFTAQETGSGTPQVTGVNESVTGSAAASMGVDLTVIKGTDAFKQANINDIKIYDGTTVKEDDAVFTVNGKKFMVVAKGTDFSAVSKDIEVLELTDVNGADLQNGTGGTDAKKLATLISQKTGLSVDVSTDPGSNYATLDFKAGTAKNGQGGLTLQVGDTNDDFNKVTVSVDDLSAKGIGTDGLDVASQSSAGFAVQTIKDAINQVSTNRANLGSLQNRLEHTINNLDTTAENMTAANSRIRDTDMAKEMMNYTKMNVLVQSAQAMLAQANQQPQSILQLLQ